jgi:hypothetical protein
MERGVVVGGLMICGSFLLAASLNRSAVKETPTAESAVAPAPIVPPLPAIAPTDVETKPAPCNTDASGSKEPVEAVKSEQDDLPGNGREACTR